MLKYTNFVLECVKECMICMRVIGYMNKIQTERELEGGCGVEVMLNLLFAA